jgi:hypothetical protein
MATLTLVGQRNLKIEPKIVIQRIDDKLIQPGDQFSSRGLFELLVAASLLHHC